jgi:hypothetical protein
MRESQRRAIWLAWTAIGALVAWLVFTNGLTYMENNGVSPNYAGVYAIVLTAIVFGGWLGVLRVAVKFPK